MTHIVIPMSGHGERFKKAGYDRPKPLIVVDGAAMIEHVVAMFKENGKLQASDRITFICNNDHLVTDELRQILLRVAPQAEIVAIASHKLGPVYAVSQIFDLLSDDEETIVNYCDFYSYWNYQDFLKTTRARGAAGCVVAYRNFHPHMLGTDNYAFIKEKDQWLSAIQEKKPFTDNRMAEYASNGTYYFARGEYVKKYFKALIDSGATTNGEYYVSEVYNLMVADSLPVAVFEVEHMLQWGTPRDLEEYQHWSDYFARLAQNKEIKIGRPVRGTSDMPNSTVNTCLIPMAGKGSRFADVGYVTPKPLIPVSNQPMVVLACDNLPPAQRYVFVAQKEHLENSQLKGVLTESFANVDVVIIDGITAGQASTCEIGLSQAAPPVIDGDSLLIGACDNGIIYDPARWQALLADQSIDVAAFSFRNHPASERNPQMFGWLKTEGHTVANITGDTAGITFPLVTAVSVKVPISLTPRQDHAIVGAFFFRKSAYFHEAMAIMLKEDVRVNGEFYVDSMIGILAAAGRRCVAFEVDDYISFGIPNDLKTFEYWQSFFHKCAWHEYRKEASKI